MKWILHWDISKNNLLLWHNLDSKLGHRRGLIIDFDYTEWLEETGDYSLGTHTVNLYLIYSWAVNNT